MWSNGTHLINFQLMTKIVNRELISYNDQGIYLTHFDNFISWWITFIEI